MSTATFTYLGWIYFVLELILQAITHQGPCKTLGAGGMFVMPGMPGMPWTSGRSAAFSTGQPCDVKPVKQVSRLRTDIPLKMINSNKNRLPFCALLCPGLPWSFALVYWTACSTPVLLPNALRDKITSCFSLDRPSSGSSQVQNSAQLRVIAPLAQFYSARRLLIAAVPSFLHYSVH
ncbi:hypothetical protein F4777DRAFT_545779 [Nemania sp. FL0916]|nr:hypothetical protein F4777DRAFT_545779 [Nemania sp. FL0916]